MKKIIKFISIFLGVIVICIVGLYGVAYLKGNPIQDEDRYIRLYDNQGDVYYESKNGYLGSYVPLDDINQDFLNAIISVEDARFYSHVGFDPIGIMRALYVNTTSLSLEQGASTITQQYARLLYLSNDKTWTRKIEETFIAMQLEMHLTKDEILEGYVNSLYFGHGIYGIQDAAHYYYDVDASDLSLQQASMLAGVINGPGYFSPLIDIESAKTRQTIVLQSMLDNQYINEQQFQESSNSQIEVASVNEQQQFIQYQYYSDMVIEQLEQLGMLDDQYINNGLEVYTTLDRNLQEELIEETQTQTAKKEIQSASIVVEPYTSKILALLGGNDYQTSQYNRATLASRHIGSTIKPFLYYLALENGFNPTTSFYIEPTTFTLSNGNTYAPVNYDNNYPFSDVTLAQAIAVSDNIYAMKTHLLLGEDKLATFVEQFGYQDVASDASLALGTLNSSIYQLANMYNAIASEGRYQEIYAINSVQDKEGTIIYQHTNDFVQLLDKDTCLQLSQLLTAPFDSQFSTYLTATFQNYQFDFLNAGKSGTTNFDSLSVGYNPSILVASWVGYDDNRPLEKENERAISKNIMAHILSSNSNLSSQSWYKPTDNLEKISINPITGELDSNGVEYWFKSVQ